MTTPTIAQIKDAVSIAACVPVHLFVKQDKARYIARPRQIAMYLAREITGHSYKKIADTFDRDHTTVIHAHRHVGAHKGRKPFSDILQKAYDILKLR